MGWLFGRQRTPGRGVYVTASCVLVASGAAAPDASGNAKPTVPVVECRTEYVPGSPPAVPTRIAIDGSPSSVRGLAAYTNHATYLIAPAGMACKGKSPKTEAQTSSCGSAASLSRGHIRTRKD